MVKTKVLEKSVPSVPEAEGNNVSSAKNKVNAKYEYDFVLNNPTDEEVCQIKQLLPTICKKALFGFEVGEEGTPHLQGYINLIVKSRFRTVIDAHECLKRCSMRPIWHSAKALIDYCQKDCKVWSWGFPKPIKIIENLYPWQKDLETIAIGEPDGRTVHWYWESKGNIGKSAFCKYMVVKHHATVVRGGKLADIMNIIFNTDMDKCNCIIFDIPRGTGGHVSYTSLEAILDGLITNTKYETGCKVFNPPNVICLANFPPDDIYKLSDDRWNIVEL